MTEIIPYRVMGQIEGDFVVFLIGMRINRIWKPHKWLPVLRAMPKMLKELEAAPPEVGFLGHNGINTRAIVQYWRSFDHLERYARDRDAQHWPAWVDFNRRMKQTRGDVGIWHETYKVRAGEYESVYSGMPPYGLGRIGVRSRVSDQSERARDRISTMAADRRPD